MTTKSRAAKRRLTFFTAKSSTTEAFWPPWRMGPRKLSIWDEALGCSQSDANFTLVADRFPEAQVLGVDLSPIQPLWVPPNLSFMVDDIEDHEWTYGSDFDLVYMRHTLLHLRGDFDSLLARVFSWFETHDERCTLITMAPLKTPSPPYDTSNYVVPAEARRPICPKTGLGRITDLCHRAVKGAWTREEVEPVHQRRALEAAGVVNVREEHFDIPMGPWPDDPRRKYLGLMKHEDLLALADPVSLKPLQNLGLSPSEINDAVQEALEMINDASLRLAIPFTVIYAQKPDGAEQAPNTNTVE
ncbi:hypothetical protein PG985_004570 [Apiospora marii]|uniref:uncharacterized protein n=1 Tax=Apiospora marii TaxID=335849 RepID=UPI003130444C